VSDWGDVVAGPRHLIVRFFGSLSSAPPSISGELWADEHLLPSERRLWTQMNNQDRRHSIAVARRFVGARPDATRAEIAGALLHDVGKIECRLGTVARVVATLVGPRTERFRSYHDHEAIGTRLVAEAGSERVTVDLVAERGPAYAALELADY
jgi:hypothetical protein